MHVDARQGAGRSRNECDDRMPDTTVDLISALQTALAPERQRRIDCMTATIRRYLSS